VGDPTTTDAAKYKVIFENEQVRVLEYRDTPGQATRPHAHPDNVMYTLSSFERRLVGENGESRESRSKPAKCGGSMPRFTAARTSA